MNFSEPNEIQKLGKKFFFGDFAIIKIIYFYFFIFIENSLIKQKNKFEDLEKRFRAFVECIYLYFKIFFFFIYLKLFKFLWYNGQKMKSLKQ